MTPSPLGYPLSVLGEKQHIWGAMKEYKDSKSLRELNFEETL